jgi:hypothetical protein
VISTYWGTSQVSGVNVRLLTLSETRLGCRLFSEMTVSLGTCCCSLYCLGGCGDFWVVGSVV